MKPVRTMTVKEIRIMTNKVGLMVLRSSVSGSALKYVTVTVLVSIGTLFFFIGGMPPVYSHIYSQSILHIKILYKGMSDVLSAIGTKSE